jgi:heme/copper-type cytochrome/quinol oxidase subunit 4
MIFCVKVKADYIYSFLVSLILTVIAIMTVMAAELVRVARSENKGKPERLR